MANILKTLKGPLSTFKKNRNGRIYSKELWERVLSSEYWEDMITHNTLCGEVVHPGERTESDPFEIDVRNISHRITEAHIEGDKLIGTVEVLDTEQGRNLLSLIDAGCTVGISARGMGDLDGDYVVPESYNFKCFDITMRPSDPNARLVPLTESERIKLIFTESECTDNLIEATVERPNFKDKSDIIKNTIVKRLFDELTSRNLEDIKFIKKPGSIRFEKENNSGNFFIVKVNTDEGQDPKYAMFSNKDRALGYVYIPVVNEFPKANYKELADTVVASINK